MEKVELKIRTTDANVLLSTSRAKQVLTEDEITRFKEQFKPAFYNWRWSIPIKRKDELKEFFSNYKIVEEAHLPPADKIPPMPVEPLSESSSEVGELTRKKVTKKRKIDVEEIKEELHINKQFETNVPHVPKTEIAFKQVGINDFAKDHFKANEPKEVLGQLLFYMHRYHKDCFPQTMLNPNDFKLNWTVVRRGDKAKGSFTFDQRIFEEAKKCVADPTKRFIIFYLSLKFEDPKLRGAASKLKKECNEYYNVTIGGKKRELGKTHKVQKDENPKQAAQMKFMIKFWSQNKHRIQTLQTEFLKKNKSEFPLIHIQSPKVIPLDESPWKYMEPTPKPNTIYRQELYSHDKAQFSVKVFPPVRYGSKTIKNRVEIEDWFRENVADVYKHAHANLIIFDTKTGYYERFEPHGQVSPVHYLTDDLNKELPKLFKKEFDLDIKKYISPLNYCPVIGLQKLQERQYRADRALFKDIANVKTGTCVAWSMFYCDLRLRNPDIPREQLIDDAIKLLTLEPQYLTRYIVNFSHFFKDAYKLLDNREKIHEMLMQFQA
jgi:hypothetical protein